MLNVAVVGVGFIGEEHVEAIRRTNLGRVVALVGRDLEKTQRKALLLGVDKYMTTSSMCWKIPKFR